MKRHGLTGTLRNKATDKQMRWDLSHTQLTDKEDEMRGRARKITTMILSSALIVTTVCGGIVLKKSNADNTASVIPGEYLKECLCLVKKQNQNTSIDSSLPLFRSLKELAKICYNFQNSRTFDVAKPLYIMKGGLERYGFGRTI